MKQVEIAKVLNVSQAIYSKWETANNIIPLTKINTLDLCQVLGHAFLHKYKLSY